MNRSLLALGLGLTAAGAAFGFERDASACGGCFHPPTQVASDITDERMLLSISPTQTTLYDQIRYSGSPTSFAWVLPIHGTVQVGLSADVLFDSMDVLTETTIVPPEPVCPAPPSDCATLANGASGFGGGSGSSSGGATAAPPTVTVTKQENVGPYDTVQLHATDSSALSNWLQQNGFSIPADVLPVINQYVTEGFDFLAMKLLPNQGIQAMRPVRVTTPGASPSLPLRMAAIGTGSTVGITIWVVSDGRYEPQNFPFFHIDDKDLVWDFSVQSSNYTTLRAQHEAALNGKGWEIESSLGLNEQLITNVVLSGGQYYGNSYGGGSSGGSFGAPPADAGDDYLPTSTADGGVGETADEVRNDDVTALFTGMAGPTVRVTRMRSDISHAAMTTDFVIEASADQTELSNVRTVTTAINTQCPIYSNCQVIGSGPPSAATPVSSTSSVGASPNGSVVGGCVAAPTSNDGPTGRFAVLAAAVGLIASRIVRARKKRSPKE